MDFELTAGGGENGVEDAGDLCFEVMDCGKEEMLNPIYSELDVYGSGILNELLSSDIDDFGVEIDAHDHAQEHGTMPETEGFKLPKVLEEEFAQHRGPGSSHGEIDAGAARLEGVVNVSDCLADKEMPQNTSEVPYELAPPGSHGNLGFHAENFPMKDELPSESQDESLVELDNGNGSAGFGAQSQCQFILQARQTEEGLSHDEELKPGLVGVNNVSNSSERRVELHELQHVQLPSKEKEEASQRVGQEMLDAANSELKVNVGIGEEEIGARIDPVAKENRELSKGMEPERLGVVNEEAKIIVANEEDDEEELDVEDNEVDDGEIYSDRPITLADFSEPPKIGAGFLSEMLRDGSLSAEGLASKGFVFISDDESDSDDSSDDEEDQESDEVSSVAESEEENVTESKSKPKTPRKCKEDSEETGPPRTKHELDVLPPVPKVTAVLQAHHKTQSVGHISSVLDLSVIVESSGTERILNENSILWLTESRVPLGIVDEVFGPVKNPFYLVRFNELSEIPEDAKSGADVSYVSEFSEFVLKDNPSLYKRAVDASGLDDEEVASEEDLEFSDDEKEVAARMREKSKRALDNRENRQGQDWKSADGQHSKGQRTESGRGRGRSVGRGANTVNAVDSAADFVAGMDLQGSRQSPRPGNRQQTGRRWNRGRQSSPRNSGLQELQTRGSRIGPADGQMSSPQHQESPQRRDGLYFAEQQANSQMLAQQVNQPGGMQGIPFNAGAIPAHLQRQGIPTQQPTTGFQVFGYQQVPGYEAQLGIPRQGNFYSVPNGPQFLQNSVVFSNPNLPPNPYFNNQGQIQMNMIHGQGYGNVVHPGQMNFGAPTHRSRGDAQPGVHPSLATFMAPSPILVSGVVSQDHRAPYVSQTSQNQGLVGMARDRYNGQRGQQSGRQQRNYPNNKGSRR